MKWFARLSMTKRLGIGFVLIAVALFAVGGIALWGLTTVTHHNDMLANQVVPGVDNLRKFQYLQESLFTYSSSIMIAPDLKAAQDYLPGRADTKTAGTDALATYGAKYLAPANKELLPQAQQAWKDLTTTDDHVVQLSLDYFKTGDKAKLTEALRVFGTDENEPYYKSVDLLEKMVANEQARSRAAVAAAGRAQDEALLWAGVALAAGIAALVALMIGVAATVTRPLGRVIASLTAAADQVTRAGEQVASSAQVLASDASEQAASLEETSASLEEIASTTRQNAEDSLAADAKTREAQDAAQAGAQAVVVMSSAVAGIQDSAERTARIIKTIDEIAYQTRLLALNAAVEAARAGEAGSGFAVVADEVRDLAQRSAEAAQSTAELIVESRERAHRGVETSSEVAEALERIAVSVDSVAQLAGAIAAASTQQSQGIDQVNVAVAEMDKVTQSSVAVAEESASASEELASQAAGLREMVHLLVRTVNGAKAEAEVRGAETAAGRMRGPAVGRAPA